MIVYHAAPGHVCALFLNLQPDKAASFCLSPQQNGNNAGSRSHIKRPFPCFYPCKAGQQYRIHAKAELLRILDDLITIPVQLIQALPFL